MNNASDITLPQFAIPVFTSNPGDPEAGGG
jgi:hypothetical protein